MKIKFIYGDQSVESTDFTQGAIDLYYEEHLNKYNKRFTGQVSLLKGVAVCEFLETNSNNLFSIEAYNNDEIKLDSLINGKLYTINKDVVNDYCRIEIRQQEVKGAVAVTTATIIEE